MLNASNPDVNYAYTSSEVIAGVQNAYASTAFEPFDDLFDLANRAGCSLS